MWSLYLKIFSERYLPKILLTFNNPMKRPKSLLWITVLSCHNYKLFNLRNSLKCWNEFKTSFRKEEFVIYASIPIVPFF